MLAKEEREAAARGEGCLGKAADDEPVFVLRAKDRLAPMIVEIWAEMAALLDSPKADDANRLAGMMRTWQVNNGSKTPD